MSLGQNNTRRNNLSREDIERYRTSVDERYKNSIEQKAHTSDFEADALEGWSHPGMTGSSLRRLDKKFIRKGKLFKLSLVLSAITFVIITSVLLTTKSKKELVNPPIQTSETATYEPSDLILPEKIDAMVELPKKEQISVKTIRNDFEANKKSEIDNPIQSMEEVNSLPVKEIEESTIPIQLVKETLFGKEIYLQDLKVLDYRAYRSKPTIQTKQIELTGTPANVSQTGTAIEEDPIWRTVDIPYIDYLSKTMEIFSKGNNKKAVARFEEILKSYPDDVNSLFYGGLCYYNLREYGLALNAFEKCLDSKYINFNEEAEWYQAKSYLANGQLEKGRSILRQIQQGGGYYAKQAEKLLK